MNDRMRTLVLLGVGHTHADVVRHWIKSPIPNCRLVCISRFAYSTYSGMLPGTLAGQFERAEMQIDLEPLVRAAGAELRMDEVVGMDPQSGLLFFAEGASLRFDVLSVGVGSMPWGVDQFRTESVVPIKPMQTFLDRLDARIESVVPHRPLRVAIVGGGVAGVEIALCLRTRLESRFAGREASIEIVTSGASVGDGLCEKSITKLHRQLKKRQIRVLSQTRVVDVTTDSVVSEAGDSIPSDLVVLATAATGPRVLSVLGLPMDHRGFLATDRTLKTTADFPVFAVGDSGTVIESPSPKAGVYAVRQAPVLWENLNRLLRNEPLENYHAQADFLKILNTGDGKALLQYKGWVIHSRWCWWLKTWIDKGFIKKFQEKWIE
ncbi:FAD-dependent oxidoreductase [Novipirellula artificiosorum]|uniref:NADH dehydrogenase n=1 Tax=Novipirellula artificiosorum TaxID=2528016 RepID=A0A5C6E5Q4_9BACT|nr:FAD-dependent oxidoreductase [Novipirellula artificiosorum]TWU42806.1 NADH dehydrogenase [Novipirellula artificiosorum]